MLFEFTFFLTSFFLWKSSFFDTNFRSTFFIDFSSKMDPGFVRQIVRAAVRNWYFLRPCLLSWFYVEFGSFWLSFWLHLAPLWCLFDHFGLPLGSPWVSFGSLLASFDSLVVFLGTVLFTLGMDSLTFGVPWHVFYFPLIFLMNISVVLHFWLLLTICLFLLVYTQAQHHANGMILT